MTQPLLEIRALSVDRGGARVVTELDTALRRGEVLSIIGSNGAGKSSLLRAVMGLGQAAKGRVLVSGEDISVLKPRDRAARGIGFCPEGRRLFPGLTVEENLAVVFEGTGRARQARIREMFDRFPALAAKRRDRAWSLSGGQQQMLAIARAIMNAPPLLLLDEPTLGLAPMIIDEVLEIVRAIAAEGTGVLMAEQNVVPALEVADRILVLSRGATVHAGPAVDITAERIATLMLRGA